MSSKISAEQLADYSFYLAEDDFPQGWTITALQDVSHVITDGTHKTPNYVASGVRFISIKNIKPFQPVNWDSYEKYITREEHEVLIRRCRPERDDILFPRIGTLGYAKRIDFDEEVSLFVGLGLIKPIKECVIPKYMEYYLNTPYISTLSKDKANGSGRMTLPLEESRKFPFPLPPLNEQRRIVAKIEELFSELDEGVESLTTALEQLAAYRQLTLKRAFEGHVTADWRRQHHEEESASALRVRLLRRRRQEWERAELVRLTQTGKEPNGDAWKKRYPEPDCFDSENLPELPSEWCWVGLDEIVSGKPRSMQSGPFGSNLLHSEFQDTGVLVLGIDNVHDGTFSMGSENRISKEKYRELERYSARPGDLLITVMASLGRTCVVPRDLEPAIITKHVYRVTMEGDIVVPEFVNLLLQGPTTSRSRMFESAQGQTRPGLNGGILKALPIPICSRAEQLEILLRLSSVLSQVDQALATINEQLAKTTALRQTILKRAFSGQLVAQDSADEPASILLERILAERKGGGTTHRRNNKNGKKEAA